MRHTSIARAICITFACLSWPALAKLDPLLLGLHSGGSREINPRRAPMRRAGGRASIRSHPFRCSSGLNSCGTSLPRQTFHDRNNGSSGRNRGCSTCRRIPIAHAKSRVKNTGAVVTFWKEEGKETTTRTTKFDEMTRHASQRGKPSYVYSHSTLE